MRVVVTICQNVFNSWNERNLHLKPTPYASIWCRNDNWKMFQPCAPLIHWVTLYFENQQLEYLVIFLMCGCDSGSVKIQRQQEKGRVSHSALIIESGLCRMIIGGTFYIEKIKHNADATCAVVTVVFLEAAEQMSSTNQNLSGKRPIIVAALCQV